MTVNENMASADTILAEALNDAHGLNLHGRDGEALDELVHAFFTDDLDETEDDDNKGSDSEGVESDNQQDNNDNIADDEESMMSIGSGDDDSINNDEHDEVVVLLEEAADDNNNDDEQDEEAAVIVDLAADILNAHEDDMAEYMSNDDKVEMERINRKIAKKCRCRNHDDMVGLHNFSAEDIFRMRYQIQALSPDCKTMFILGKIAFQGIDCGQRTKSKKKKHKDRERRRVILGYYIDGVKVCRDVFVFLHA